MFNRFKIEPWLKIISNTQCIIHASLFAKIIHCLAWIIYTLIYMPAGDLGEIIDASLFMRLGGVNKLDRYMIH